MSSAATPTNAPTPERQRRSAFLEGPAVATEEGPARAGSRVYRSLSVLERLLQTGAIEPRQADAAERLRADYELGVIGIREASSGSTSTVGWYYPEARLAAQRRYTNAIASLGPTRHIVLIVAIDDVPISTLALSAKRNRQEIAGILKLGLSTLADHYGIDCDRTKISHNMLTRRNGRPKHSGNRP